MNELAFNAPDEGVWEQDGTHSPRPLTRFAQAQHGTPASVATTVGHADFDWFRITR